MDTNCYICKIPIIDGDSVCIINSEWLSTEIILLFLHDNRAWKGKFQLSGNEDIEELLDQLSLTKDMYVEESRKALTTHGGASDFTYKLENDKFIWKKIVRKNLSVIFGSVDLLKVPIFEAFEEILDKSLQSNITLSTKLQNSDKQRGALEKENSTLKLKLEEVVGKKNEMELQLYSQFLHILNEKKRKIKELKKNIPSVGNEDSVQNDESDHFDSDTEIDSEEEDKISASKSPFEKSRLDVEDKPVTIPKWTSQKRQNLAGPSGECSKVKNSKVFQVKQPKRKTVPNRKVIKPKESCVIGKISPKNENNLSEESEDVFKFQNHSKIIVKKATTNKIIYESDDETEFHKELESDSDKTPSQIDQIEPFNGNANYCDSFDDRPVTEGRGNVTEVGAVKGEKKEINGNSEVTKKTNFRGLSSSTLSILNQLI